jgi:hypothetical protein
MHDRRQAVKISDFFILYLRYFYGVFIISQMLQSVNWWIKNIRDFYKKIPQATKKRSLGRF